nr:hypothetical protein CFP56_10109 [Quercus suber]
MYGRANQRGGRTRGRGGSSRFNSKPAALKGLFKDNIWHCNCSPRLPAEHFKVKKEGKNQGRWFYTCQQQDPKRCDFFLWDEDARLRMEGAVLAGKSNEVLDDAGLVATRGHGREKPSGKGVFARVGHGSTSRDEDEMTLSPSPPPPYDSHKRSAQVAGIESDDDEAFPWPLTGVAEGQLSTPVVAVAPMTPHKAQKTGVYATPATSAKRVLPWLQEHGPMTPGTTSTHAVSSLETPSKAPAAVNLNGSLTPNKSTSEMLMPKSPSPPRHKNALVNPADSASSLASEALAVLAPLSIPPHILSNLRSILSKHDLRTQGITKGRDISRLAIKAKDAKVAELQAKIASLEAEREMERGLQSLRRQRVARDLADNDLDDEL